jgi:putative ABC transport system permease protein
MASIAIFIGVLGVVTLGSSGDLIIRQLRSDLKESELAMQQVFVSAPSGIEVNNAQYIDKLETFPGVTQVEGRAVYPLSWKLPASSEFEDGYILAAWEPFEQIALQPMRLTGEGRYPVVGQNEIVIEKRMADKYELGIGDGLVLRVLGGGMTREETWQIVGVVFQPYASYSGAGPPAVPSDASVFATYEDAQLIAGFAGFNAFLVRYTDFTTAKEQADRLYATVSQDTPYVAAFNYIDDPAQSFIITVVKQVTDMLTMLGIVAMVVSGILVVNVINSIVVEQKRQIGVMKSMGATRWDNFVMYVGVALSYGVIGLVPGVILGVILGSIMAQALGSMAFTFIDGFGVSSVGILLGIIMGLAVPVVAALLPVFLGTRVTILEATTDVGIAGNFGRGPLTRAFRVLRLPNNVRQALINLTRKKGRLALTWLTLTLAVAAFMGIFAVFFSLSERISGIYDAFGYQVNVVPNERQDFGQLRTLILEEVDEVKAVFPGVGLAIELEGYVEPNFGTAQLSMIGFDPRTDTFDLDLKVGTAWEGDPDRQGIVLTTGVAEQLGKTVGDLVVLSARGRTTEHEIIGIASFPAHEGFMEWRALARLAGSTLGAPTPNEYVATVRVEGYGGTLPDGEVVALGIDEKLVSFIAPSANVAGDSPGIIISRDVAAKGEYQIGEHLSLAVGENNRTYPVAAIVDLPPAMASGGAPTDVVALHWEELASLEGRDLLGEPAAGVLLIQLNSADPTVGQVDDAMKSIKETLVAAGITATYVNQVKSAEDGAQSAMTFGMMFSLAAIVMAAVGAIGLLSTLSMSVFERQREIGVMRSIGAGSWTVAGQFLVEGILVGMIAWVIGAPLSYLLAKGLVAMLPFGIDDIGYAPIALVVGLGGMIVIATVASLWPSIGAARKTVSQILRYQ